jgi:PAP2 superfamily
MKVDAAKVVLTVVLLSCAARLGTSTQFYTEALVSAYFALTLIGATIIHLRVHPSGRDASLVILGCVLFAFIDFRLLHFKPAIVVWLSFAGLSSLLIMGVKAVWADRESRKLHLLTFVPSVLFVTSEYFADDMLKWASTVHLKVYDLYLYTFDASLHVQIPFLVGQQFALHPTLRATALLAYIGLSIPIAFVYAGQVRRIHEKALQCFAVFVLTGPIGILFYNFVPALGPVHLLQRNFPWNPLSTEQAARVFLEPLALAGPRNAIPSLHLAWVLLAWWYSRGLSWWERGIALFYVIFVGLATLGTGEHYFIDLIVGVPFALFMESTLAFDFNWSDAKRVSGVAFGLLATLAWLVSLRFAPHIFWSTPVLPWTLCAATVSFSLYLERQLHSHSRQIASEPIATQPAPAH